MTEPTWRGCVIPAELAYDTERHVWVRFDGDTAVMGMTDIAQTMGGKVVSISWKATGKEIKKGRSLAVIESAKWVGPFPTPLSCELLETNAKTFEEDILTANRDPYGEGWLVRVRPTNLDEERAELVDATMAFERYKEFIESEDIRCFRCAD
jgi:glycine cleavage system H protein